MLKKTLILIGSLLALAATGFSWLLYLAPDGFDMQTIKQTKIQDTAYYQSRVTEKRGKILAVVTSIDQMGMSGKGTGYEFGELARAYWVFEMNGFEVDIASTQGGKAPVVFDDMWEYEHAFLNDETAQHKVNHTLHIDEVNWQDYQGVYFVGGKGAMWDFPDNPAIKNLVKNLYQNDRVVSAVCHGPAALVNVKLDNGKWLLNNKRVNSFTNEEELFLIPDAEHVFPFLLEDKLVQQGGTFEAGYQYLEKVVADGNLITGQNPWSVWELAEQVVAQVGYTPVERNMTKEEQSVRLVMTYADEGYDAATALIKTNSDKYERGIVLVHGVLAFMKFEFGKGFELLLLTHKLRGLQG